MTLVSSPVRLGELDIASPYDILYQVGELLARRNAQHELFLPGFLSEVVVTLTLCQWEVSLPHHARYVAPQRFAPEKAAQQFAELEGERLRALLGGYGRLAYQLLDSQYPGFTDQLLAQLLPAPLPLVTRPRLAVYDFNRVLQIYGVSLGVDTKEPHLVFAVPTVPLEPPTDEQLVAGLRDCVRGTAEPDRLVIAPSGLRTRPSPDTIARSLGPRRSARANLGGSDSEAIGQWTGPTTGTRAFN